MQLEMVGHQVVRGARAFAGVQDGQ